jgi:hypothetical protein
MSNIFGRLPAEGLTNPLTENLQGADFNIYDINELHINELHDQDGIDKILVHEDFNMLNNSVTNMADPVAAKDAVTLSYYEANLPSTSTPFYDIYGAFGDETTPISVGFQVGTLQAVRNFTASSAVGFLTNGATSSNYTISIYKNGTLISTATFTTAGDKTSVGGSITGINQTFTQGDIITVAANTDATASGLKVAILGES